MNIKEQYGEFVCEECGKTFFQKRLLDCHMGSHARNYVGKPKCKICKTELTDKNWLPSLKKSSNLLCRKCLRTRNKNSYLNKKKRIMEEKKKGKDK